MDINSAMKFCLLFNSKSVHTNNMIKKHCLILPFVWTLFQMSYVLCNELSPEQNNELNRLIKNYSEIYGLYKTAECVALLAVRKNETIRYAKDFNEVISDTKFQISKIAWVDSLNDYMHYKGFPMHHYSDTLKDIRSKLEEMKSKIDLTTVYDNFVKFLRNAWTARKDLYTKAALYYKAEDRSENAHPNQLMFEDKLGKPIEKEFIKSRDNAERKCLRMSGMQVDKNGTKDE
ncbi:unnamed protein product [Trichobilharzia szidati]|nr:unnamed protein product [Trichobilharzia szidati]